MIWERAVGEQKAASYLNKPWRPTKALWRSIRKPTCLKVGPGPRTIWASRSRIWERAAAEKKAASCLSKPWPHTKALWRSIQKPTCLRIGPGPRTIWTSRLKNSQSVAAEACLSFSVLSVLFSASLAKGLIHRASPIGGSRAGDFQNVTVLTGFRGSLKGWASRATFANGSTCCGLENCGFLRVGKSCKRN